MPSRYSGQQPKLPNCTATGKSNRSTRHTCNTSWSPKGKVSTFNTITLKTSNWSRKVGCRRMWRTDSTKTYSFTLWYLYLYLSSCKCNWTRFRCMGRSWTLSRHTKRWWVNKASVTLLNTLLNCYRHTERWVMLKLRQIVCHPSCNLQLIQSCFRNYCQIIHKGTFWMTNCKIGRVTTDLLKFMFKKETKIRF